MGSSDRGPVEDTPVTGIIEAQHNNRLGAVYSSLYAFWLARSINSGAAGIADERDAYSVILFNHYASICLENDHTSTPEELLNLLLPHRVHGFTDYSPALEQARSIMSDNWVDNRSVDRIVTNPHTFTLRLS